MFGFGPFIEGAVSFAFLVFASWCVGEGGEILGKKYDASIIGGVVIAWLNTAPEAIFFITALNSGNARFAVGAVSGSAVVVCTIALGACLYIGASTRHGADIQLQPAVKTQCAILGMSTFITFVIVVTGFTVTSGIAGIGFYLWFMWFSLHEKQPEDSKGHDEEMGLHEEEEEEDEPVQKGFGYLAVGGFLIILCSSPFINSVVEAAEVLKVNPILLAFFLAPVASEAPEILESISLSRKGNSQSINIAYSNLVGGTITKTTLLLGIFCLFGVAKDFEWESPAFSLSLSLLLVCAATAAGIGYFLKSQTKTHGLCLFALFAVVGIIQYLTNVNVDPSFGQPASPQ